MFCCTNTKLNRCKLHSLQEMLNNYRSNNVATIPTGFHKTVIHTLSKYKLETWWNNCPQIPANEIKNHLKKTIWLKHWHKDVRTTLTYDCFFSSVLLNHTPKYPYKNQLLIDSLKTIQIPRQALHNVS